MTKIPPTKGKIVITPDDYHNCCYWDIELPNYCVLSCGKDYVTEKSARAAAVRAAYRLNIEVK